MVIKSSCPLLKIFKQIIYEGMIYIALEKPSCLSVNSSFY